MVDGTQKPTPILHPMKLKLVFDFYASPGSASSIFDSA